MAERETLTIKHEAALPPVRAVRSLAWNRKMLPVVQARMERAESVVRAHLLLNGNGCLRVGPYEISLNGDGEIVVNRIETSDWRQLPLPESELPKVGDVEEIAGTIRSDNGLSANTNEDETI